MPDQLSDLDADSEKALVKLINSGSEGKVAIIDAAVILFGTMAAGPLGGAAVGVAATTFRAWLKKNTATGWLLEAIAEEEDARSRAETAKLMAELIADAVQRIAREEEPNEKLLEECFGQALGAIAEVNRIATEGLAVGKDTNVLVKSIEKSLLAMLDKKDSQLESLRRELRERDSDIEKYRNIAEALVEELHSAHPPEGIAKAVNGVERGDTAAAEAIFRRIRDEKKAVAAEVGAWARKAAAEASRYLGALAFLRDTQAALDAYTEATLLDPESPAGWNELGLLLYRLGRLDEAKDAFGQVLSRAGEDPFGQGVALRNLGLISLTRGDFDEAEEFSRRSLKLDEELGRKEGMAIALGNLGVISRSRGNLDEAEAFYRRSLKFDEELGRNEGIATMLGNLGVISQARGKLDEAEDFQRQSQKIYKELGRNEGIAATFNNLGVISEARGNLGEAEVFYRRSLKLDKELGRRAGMAESLGNLGKISQARGNLDEAEALFRRSLKLDEELGHKAGIATTLNSLGVISQGRGNLGEAEAFYRRSLKLAEALGSKESMSTALGNLGFVLMTQRKQDEAESFYRRSLKLDEALGRKESMATALGNVGIISRTRGNLAEARRCMTQALALAEEVGDAETAEWAKIFLAKLVD